MLTQLKNKIICLFALTTIVIAVALAVIAFTSIEQVKRPLDITETALFTVEKGSSFHRFSKQLVNRGWLQNRFWLRNYVRLYPELAKIKSGTYQVLPHTPLIELLKQIVAGKEHQFSITFIEGYTFKQALAELSQHRYIDNNLLSLSETDIAKHLNIAQNNPEGWLFPDTYLFTNNTPGLAIIERAHQRMQKHLQQCWQQRSKNLPYDDPYQALIMASIIEKETAEISEQRRIASVFVNRLRKKMRLQTDPTIIYGLGDRYQGDITYAHIREYTPYNTYIIKGLPPTPIALPGKKALCAALTPEQSDYLYFVSSGQGRHIFSTNLAAHNRAVKQYQKR